MKTGEISPIHIKRKEIRLPDYDYTRPGAYFITVCTQNNECLFGEIVKDEWKKTAQIRQFVELDEYIVMPDHIHGIVIIKEPGTARRAPTGERFGKPVAGSLSTILRGFKSAVTKRINVLRSTPGEAVCQRGYYEHVIRRNEKINLVREYIANNPLRWYLGEKRHEITRDDFFGK